MLNTYINNLYLVPENRSLVAHASSYKTSFFPGRNCNGLAAAKVLSPRCVFVLLIAKQYFFHDQDFKKFPSLRLFGQYQDQNSAPQGWDFHMVSDRFMEDSYERCAKLVKVR